MQQTTLTNELKPIEAETIRLYCSGQTKSDAYRLTHPTSRAKPEHINTAAWKFFNKAYVRHRVDEILRHSSVEDIITHGQVVIRILEGLERAVSNGNSTAEAAFTQQLGKAVGMFKDRVLVGPEKSETDEQLIARLSGGDPHKATMLRSIIGKDSFA